MRGAAVGDVVWDLGYPGDDSDDLASLKVQAWSG